MKNFRLLQLAFISILVFGMFSCSQPGGSASENVKHYRHLLFTETPWEEIRGTYPISSEQAKTINHYTFTYDDLNRLVSVEYGRGDSLLDGSRLGAAKVLISYEENKEIRYYLNTSGDSVSIAGAVFKSVYDLDETGFKKGLKFYNKAGDQVENWNKIASYTWSKTPLGMVKENRYTLAGKETVLSEFCPFYELRFSFDENGVVKRMANYEKDMLYDCTAENCGNIGVSYFDFEIDEKGSLLTFSVHSTTGQMSNLYWGWARMEMKVDENGYGVERVMYDQDDELLGGKMVPITVMEYDEHGSLIEERYLDANRQLMETSWDSVAVRQYKYNEYGSRIETTLFNKDMVKKES